MSKQKIFCDELAGWLFEQDWRFKTLLAVCIETVANLPDDADAVIHRLLDAFPGKPTQENIAAFLQNDASVNTWFRWLATKPRMVSFNLDVYESPPLINDELPQFGSTEDLATWLEVTHQQLDWLADLKRYDAKTPAYLNHYVYTCAAKRDGRLRLLESPKSLLKNCQRKINRHILGFAKVHDAAHGFIKERNCTTHAESHVAKKYLYSFDLADCFQSTGWASVYAVFRNLGYAAQIAKHLTALCTHITRLNDTVLESLTTEQRNLLSQRHLPQGSPTSPALSNTVLFRLDKRLHGLAKSLDLHYTRYADDLVFSGDHYKDLSNFEPLVGSICLEQGFSLNHRKTRLRKPHQRQKVTGIVVNQKVNVDRRYYDNLKAVLTNCTRHGLDGQNRFHHPDFRAHLLGRVQHVKSLSPRRGEKLQVIFDRIQ